MFDRNTHSIVAVLGRLAAASFITAALFAAAVYPAATSLAA